MSTVSVSAPLRLAQIRTQGGWRRVVATGGDGVSFIVPGVISVQDLAVSAIGAGRTLTEEVHLRAGAAELEHVDLKALAAAGGVLAPLDHPDPAHLYVTGTGLTHLGSAEGRDQMHRKLKAADDLTDSMKMFRKGLEGGKPPAGEVGVQPEWFYKGDGSIIAAPGAPLESPSFALDGGEEPEIVGLYIIGPDGAPWRIGFSLGNEFSDHVTERENYLYLAHSKLRVCSFGPEILVGALPDDIRGTSRIRRGGTTLWEKPFLSGEANMSHALANLEAHHFKYGLFRRPGDLHVHYFGTATLSFSDGVRTEPGDVFEIEAEPFGLPLANPLAIVPAPSVSVRVL
ncbi:AraD1 family protein [Segnochrobactrum spirostomi]|uniref:FAH family protein n=1 Tax=Segnochrobactrum spirostomi TaxID=2608987 RepID=A0A6A7XXT7_9HYPH|nr:AraD1 family protein [Segnochrobactrum spirostomi]MQT11173.1 FAH family protein [Segnochrobactrum spirostomi]